MRTENLLSLLEFKSDWETQAKLENSRIKLAQDKAVPFHSPQEGAPTFAKDAFPF